jgi:hypothetical protein
LLRAVVQIAHDATARVVAGGEETARDAVSWPRLSALAIAVSSSPANCAIRSSLSAEGASSPPVCDGDAPEPTVRLSAPRRSRHTDLPRSSAAAPVAPS